MGYVYLTQRTQRRRDAKENNVFLRVCAPFLVPTLLRGNEANLTLRGYYFCLGLIL